MVGYRPGRAGQGQRRRPRAVRGSRGEEKTGLGGIDDEPETIAMLPVDSSGDRFVGRSDPSEEWFPVTFGTLPDGRAQVTFSGRITPRV